MRRANRWSLELRYAEEHATPLSLDESFGSVDNASEPEEKHAASLESGAVLRPKDTCRRSRKGDKGGLMCLRQQRRAGERVGDLEKQLAAVRLGSLASSEGSSIDNPSEDAWDPRRTAASRFSNSPTCSTARRCRRGQAAPPLPPFRDRRHVSLVRGTAPDSKLAAHLSSGSDASPTLPNDSSRLEGVARSSA